MITTIDRVFSGLNVYNVLSVVKMPTPDGPATKKEVTAVLAASPELALGVVRKVLAGADSIEIMQLEIALEGVALHYAPAYD